MFEDADKQMRKALSVDQLRQACIRAKTAPKDTLVYNGAKKFLESGCNDLEPNELISYYDFLGIMLGRRRAEVYLYCYDIANGKAPLLSPFVGEYWEGIWHTGLVAFGKEYWY